MPEISVSAGVKTVKHERRHFETIEELVNELETPTEEEAWWSGHLWEGNRHSANWRGTDVVVVDVDYMSTAKEVSSRHSPPPEEKRVVLEGAVNFPGSVWYLTPRGLRVAFVLSERVIDPAQLEKIQKSVCRQIIDALSELDIYATLDGSGKPQDGYAIDWKTMDVARIMFAPNSIVEGCQRSAILRFEPGREWYDNENLINTAEFASRSSASNADGGSIGADLLTIGERIAKQKTDGDNDGSLAAIKVANLACRLGIKTSDDFVKVTRLWNMKRTYPLTVPELVKKFDDAYTRFEASGLITTLRNETGGTVYTRATLHRILSEDRVYQGLLTCDIRREMLLYGGKEINPEISTEIEIDICERYMMTSIPRQAMIDSIEAICYKHSFDTVQDYLLGLEWDGESRIDRIAAEVMHALDPMAGVYIRKWLYGAVERAFSPGCKVDEILILAGAEGIYKSTFAQILAVEASHFKDTKFYLDHNGFKDALEKIGSTWIYELSEIDDYINKSSEAILRGFLSSQKDHYRASYARRATNHPRRGVFIGTCNPTDFLRSPTNNRRFWIINVERKFNLAKLEAWVPQIWAEAVIKVAENIEHKDPYFRVLSESQAESLKKGQELNLFEDPEILKIGEAVESLMSAHDFKGWLTQSMVAEKYSMKYRGTQAAEIPPYVSNKIKSVLKVKQFKNATIWYENKTKKVWQLAGWGER